MTMTLRVAKTARFLPLLSIVPVAFGAAVRAEAAGQSLLDANKAAARGFLDLAFNQKKPEAAVAKYVGPYYRQHNPMAADGKAAFIAFVRNYVRLFPSERYEIKRVVAEDDLVMVHSHGMSRPGDPGVAVVDIFRLEKGKIVEHWDVVQPVPAKAANQNTMF
jgi:predicted SnoaL-like aldol condensation-catalyzing enzyme